MTFEQIRRAITARMSVFPGIDQVRIDYPNALTAFTPPESGLWCRLSIQHGQAFMAGMADRPHSRKPGMVTIQCFDRIGAGLGALNRLADSLEEHFSYWSQGDLECLEASQVDVGTGDSVGRPQGLGFYQINVNIRFRAG